MRKNITTRGMLAVAVAIATLLMIVLAVAPLVDWSEEPVEVTPTGTDTPTATVTNTATLLPTSTPTKIDITIPEIPDNTPTTVPTVGPTNTPTQEPRRVVDRKPEIRYHVVELGDSLWKIAGVYLNNPYAYPTLQALNDIAPCQYIYPGDKIVLP